MSIIGWLIIGILFVSELNRYLVPRVKEHISVDTTLGHHLQININISFHALTCAEVIQIKNILKIHLLTKN